MSITVKLEGIIEGLEAQGDMNSACLNKKTGKVVIIGEEEFALAETNNDLDDIPDWQRESVQIAKEILETDKYIPLPDRFDINEYGMMERFCLSLADNRLREQIYNLIKGSGTFRRFKENIYRYGIADAWYKYRENEFNKIAIDWCEFHNIP